MFQGDFLFPLFLWDSANRGQVGLRESMLFSHTKNNNHHLVTVFWDIPVFFALLEFATVIDVSFAVPIKKKKKPSTKHKPSSVLQGRNLLKDLPSHMVSGEVLEVGSEIFRVALTTLQPRRWGLSHQCPLFSARALVPPTIGRRAPAPCVTGCAVIFVGRSLMRLQLWSHQVAWDGTR